MCWRLHNGRRQHASKGRCCMNTLIPNRMSNEQTRNGAEGPAFTSAFLREPPRRTSRRSIHRARP